MIRSKKENAERVIDLTGPQGNAFFLLGYANNLAKQLCFNAEKIKSEMMEGDYEHLVATFDKYFGDYIILER
jgi:hypothetical protein